MYAAIDEAHELHIFHHTAGKDSRSVVSVYPSEYAIQDTLTALATAVSNHIETNLPSKQEEAMRCILAHLRPLLSHEKVKKLTSEIMDWTLQPDSVIPPPDLPGELRTFV